MPKRLYLLLPALSLCLTACGGDAAAGDSDADGAGVTCDYPSGGEAARPVEAPPSEAQYSGEVGVTIGTSGGDLRATLDADAAPCTVNSFLSLAEQGFFDDSPCPRITDSGGLYVLQCGDPTGTTAGGPGYTIPDEVTGEETYPAGTLAMANSGLPDSGGSQFFVVWRDSMLDPAYTVFGHLDAAAVQSIADMAAKGNDGSNPAGGGKPNEPIDITKVTVD